MGTFINLTNKKFNRLTVIKQVGKDKWGGYLWLCVCKCGTKKVIKSMSLVNCDTKSCGCLMKEIAKKNVKFATKKAAELNIVHGLSKHPIFKVVADMKSRCTNSKDTNYKNYGGRGIKFLFPSIIDCINHLFNIGWQKGLQVDRINNNGHYQLGNIRIVNHKTNCRNKRNNHFITIFNENKTLADWADDLRCKVGYMTFTTRLKRGWKPLRALTTSPLILKNQYAK